MADQLQHAEDLARVLHDAGVYVRDGFEGSFPLHAEDVLHAMTECGVAFIHPVTGAVYEELIGAQ